MRLFKIITTMLLLTCASVAHGQFFSLGKPVLTLTGGTASGNPGDSQSFTYAPVNGFFDYIPSGNSQSRPLFGIFFGDEIVLSSFMAVQVGVGYYQSLNWSVNGNVTQGIDPPTQNSYSYQYQLNNYQMLFESKFLFAVPDSAVGIFPYLSAGIGAALNRFYNFEFNIQPPFTSTSNQFTNSYTASWTYSVGAGVEFEFPSFKTMGVGIGYRFSDLGKVQSGDADVLGQTTNYQLTQDHFYVNEMLIQLTYLFN